MARAMRTATAPVSPPVRVNLACEAHGWISQSISASSTSSGGFNVHIEPSSIQRLTASLTSGSANPSRHAPIPLVVIS